MGSPDVTIGRRSLVRSAGAPAATTGAAGTARAAGEPWSVLRLGQAAAIEALGDTLLPGAAATGLAHFVDAQLAKPPERERVVGATGTWAAPMAQQHVLGGTAIGSDPARSVANGFGQAHDHETLFLAGAGLFPTSGAVNPTFTLSALALRSAGHMVRNWSSLA